MDAKEFDVEVVYRQRAIYRVRAVDREAAERAGLERWQSEEQSVVAGYDWGEVEGVFVAESTDQRREQEDAELVYRFLRERERLIRRLAGGIGPSPNDAISASQVASDLGWNRRVISGTPSPDIPRAARALERLCEERRVVCFERPRVRGGERGEIRLYCTPEYLEGLTSDMDAALPADHGR